MGKRDDLIEKYAAVIKDDLGLKLDADLLRKVTIGCGPSIYNRDASTVAASDPSELETVKNSFLIKKLGLKDSSALDDGIATVMKAYDKRSKYRAVVYYLLTVHFKKQSVYG